MKDDGRSRPLTFRLLVAADEGIAKAENTCRNQHMIDMLINPPSAGSGRRRHRKGGNTCRNEHMIDMQRTEEHLDHVVHIRPFGAGAQSSNVPLGDEGKNKWYVLYIIHLSTNIHSMVEHSAYINALARPAWFVIRISAEWPNPTWL